MDKKYGSYTNEELNNWQVLPENSRVLTSSAFGAWLLRRDERKGNRDLITELEKIKTEIDDYDIIEVSDSIKMGFDTMQGIALKVLGDRISELKG